MICHVCQNDKDLSKGCVYSTGVVKLWSCSDCIKSIDRVVELEDTIRKVRDRLYQLSASIKDEPWMVRLANESFRPTYSDLKDTVNTLDLTLWRRTS
jgi:hypothetical protein